MNCSAQLPGDDDSPSNYRELVARAVPPVPVSEERLRRALAAAGDVRPAWVPWAWVGFAIVTVAFWWFVTAMVGGWL